MKNPDLTKLAEHVRETHSTYTPMRLPALKGSDIQALVKLLDQPVPTELKTVH